VKFAVRSQSTAESVRRRRPRQTLEFAQQRAPGLAAPYRAWRKPDPGTLGGPAAGVCLGKPGFSGVARDTLLALSGRGALAPPEAMAGAPHRGDRTSRLARGGHAIEDDRSSAGQPLHIHGEMIALIHTVDVSWIVRVRVG
jgi:hypothetical protein